MRIDKYLKVSRLIKRRTVANDVADAGRILVNGKAVKASYAVKVGDVIEILSLIHISSPGGLSGSFPALCTV